MAPILTLLSPQRAKRALPPRNHYWKLADAQRQNRVLTALLLRLLRLVHRAITHIHTGHSWDSRIAPTELLDRLIADGVSLALISDHDSFAGSLDCRAILKKQSAPLRVPISAEIRTDEGDVIVVFDDDGDLPTVDVLKTWGRLISEVRQRNGLIWLPHPYHGHRSVEILAAEADVIEVFNGRCSPDQNAAAVDLCQRHRAVPAYGADVHRLGELTNVIVEYQPAPGASTIDILRHEPTPLVTTPTRTSNIMAAEITYGVHKKRPSQAGWFGAQYALHKLREFAEGSRR